MREISSVSGPGCQRQLHVEAAAAVRVTEPVYVPTASPVGLTETWTDEGVVMIDQRVLPREETYITARNYLEMADAIKTMVIRGAPAIGVAAAYGLALGARTPAAREMPHAVEHRDHLAVGVVAQTERVHQPRASLEHPGQLLEQFVDGERGVRAQPLRERGLLA